MSLLKCEGDTVTDRAGRRRKRTKQKRSANRRGVSLNRTSRMHTVHCQAYDTRWRNGLYSLHKTLRNYMDRWVQWCVQYQYCRINLSIGTSACRVRSVASEYSLLYSQPKFVVNKGWRHDVCGRIYYKYYRLSGWTIGFISLFFFVVFCSLFVRDSVSFVRRTHAPRLPMGSIFALVCTLWFPAAFTIRIRWAFIKHGSSHSFVAAHMKWGRSER